MMCRRVIKIRLSRVTTVLASGTFSEMQLAKPPLLQTQYIVLQACFSVCASAHSVPLGRQAQESAAGECFTDTRLPHKHGALCKPKHVQGMSVPGMLARVFVYFLVFSVYV